MSGDYGKSRQEQNDIAAKYQALTDNTVLIGVVKEKVSKDELEEVHQIPFMRKNFQQGTPKKRILPSRIVETPMKEL